MASSQGPPSPAEMENLGALFVGFIIATFLYGLTFFQTYIYFSRFTKDHIWTRVLVASLALLDSASTALVTNVVFYYMIQEFNINMETLRATTTSCVQCLLFSIVILITQFFFASRLHTVCGGPASITSRIITLIVSLFALVTFALGLISVVQLFRQRQLSALASYPMEVVVGVGQGSAVAAFVIIFIAMYWSLRPVRYPDMLVPEGVIDKFVAVFVIRGLGLVIFQAACFSTFLALPAKPYWISLQMVTFRVCVNTLIGLLNAREVKQGVGFNVEETVSEPCDENNINNNNGLPTLHFRWSPKGTQHETINLSTHETESERSEIEEVRKTYGHDDHLDSIGSHSSEPPEKTKLSSELGV